MVRGPRKHLKRLNAPKHWMLDKLGGVFAPRQSCGPHKLRECLPLMVFLRNRLKYALTYQEVIKILAQRLIKVDGKVRTDKTYPAGFMDVITIDRTAQNFRLIYDVKGRFTVHQITPQEAEIVLKFIMCDDLSKYMKFFLENLSCEHEDVRLSVISMLMSIINNVPVERLVQFSEQFSELMFEMSVFLVNVGQKFQKGYVSYRCRKCIGDAIVCLIRRLTTEIPDKLFEVAKQFLKHPKFLKKYDDKFDFHQDTSRVYLKDYTSPRKPQIVVNQAPDEEPNRSARAPTPPPHGHCWFNFDDSNIRPISSQEIERQFSGKESAYMLFYRRKSLARPRLAAGNPAYGLSDHLIETVIGENEKLQQEREEYDRRMNTITLHVYFDHTFYHENGALHIDKDPFFLDVSIDRRKSIEELVEAIEQGSVRAVGDAGLKAVSFDSGPPMIHKHPSVDYSNGGDEHGIITPAEELNRHC